MPRMILIYQVTVLRFIILQTIFQKNAESLPEVRSLKLRNIFKVVTFQASGWF